MNSAVAKIDRAGVIERAARAASSLPMVWGRDDCGLWAAGILLDITGVDIAAPYRGRYDSATGAADTLGVGGLAQALKRAADDAGWPAIEPGRCLAGDIGLIETPAGPACVLCYSADWWVGRDAVGVTFTRTGLVRLAWSVT